MSKKTTNYQQLAMALGLRLDETRNVIYGQRNGFDVIAYAEDSRNPYMFTVTVGAKGGTLERTELKQFVKSEKSITSVNYDGNLIKLFLRNTPNQEKLREGFNNGLNAFISFLRSKGYEPCCQLCGQYVETVGYEVAGAYMHLCPDCAGKFRQDMALASQQKQQKGENVIGGIVGALLGSVIGVICIIFFSQLGRVAVISGIVMAICTVKGYEMLGGKLTKKGIVISIIMMFVMTYVGDRMDWAIWIARELDTDFFTAFQYVPLLLEEEMLDATSYWYNLALLYVFTIGGAIPTVMQVLKDRKVESKFGQLGSMTEMQ